VLPLSEGYGMTVGVGGGSVKLVLDGVTGKVNPELLFVDDSIETKVVEVTAFSSTLLLNTIYVICLSPSNIILLAPFPSEVEGGTFSPFLLAWPSSSDSSRALIQKPLLFSGRVEEPSKINDFAWFF
jgi:hypothetical protein